MKKLITAVFVLFFFVKFLYAPGNDIYIITSLDFARIDSSWEQSSPAERNRFIYIFCKYGKKYRLKYWFPQIYESHQTIIVPYDKSDFQY